MSTKPFCEVYLIRHGETDWNTNGRLQGHVDILLNIEGEAQVLKLNMILKVMQKFTSV